MYMCRYGLCKRKMACVRSQDTLACVHEKFSATLPYSLQKGMYYTQLAIFLAKLQLNTTHMS